MAHPPPGAAAQRESQGKKKLVNEEGPRARCEGQTTGHAGQGGPVRATDQRPALATEGERLPKGCLLRLTRLLSRPVGEEDHRLAIHILVDKLETHALAASAARCRQRAPDQVLDAYDADGKAGDILRGGGGRSRPDRHHQEQAPGDSGFLD